MSINKARLAGYRKYVRSINLEGWTGLRYVAVWLTAARRNRMLQAAVLLLVTLAALPLDYQNLRALTTPLTEVINGRSQGGDFIAFYAAGRLYAAHHDATAYDLDALQEMEFQLNPSLRTDPLWAAAHVNPYRNPPFYLPVVGYLARFSLPVAFAVTTVLQAMLLGALIAVTAALAGGRALPLAAIAWGTIALAYYHSWVGFNYAQLPAYIVVLAFAGGVLLFRGGRMDWAGIVFAVVWVKLQYFPPLVLFLLVRREWHVLRGLAVGTTLLLLASVMLVGFNGLHLYVETMVHLSTAPKSEYFVNYEWMFNWRGLLERAFHSSMQVLLLQVILTAITYALSVWVWSASVIDSDWRRDVQLITLTLAMILASPHVHGQDMMLLLVAGAFVARYTWDMQLPWLISAVGSLGLLLFFWAVPQQVLITPTMNFSVLLLAFVFLGTVLILRGGVTIQASATNSSAI